jgi:hypothetical protein
MSLVELALELAFAALDPELWFAVLARALDADKDVETWGRTGL